MQELPNAQGTVLVIDDEPNVLWFIATLCQPMGYMTITAGGGMEGLKIIQEYGDKIDLVLLDLKMPGMGGLEVLKSIRKYRPAMSVIVITGYGDRRQECEALGIDAFITKPYELKELYQQIERVVEKRSFDRNKVQIPEGQQPSAKILIVDDEEEVCELLASSLREDVHGAHFEVLCTRSGDEALRLSTKFKPDIGIIDIKMPQMWGDELVRRFQTGQGHLPKDFIIYTSVTEPREVEQARRLGFKILTKPTQLDTLVDVLKKLCVKHKLLQKI